jgi:hypothetical protein
MRLQRLVRGLCALAILWIVLINLRQAHQAHNSSGAEAQYQHQGRVANVALPRDTRTATPDRRWTVGQLAAVGVKPKAFTWNGTVPCYEPDDLMKLSNGYRQPAKDGLLFLKTIKTGGSTATGITMRIAKHTAERNKKKYWICRGRWDHQWAIRLLKERVRDRSFTWTVIRDPTERAISDFFHFGVSRQHLPTDDSTFQTYLLEKDKMKNTYLKMLSLEQVPLLALNKQYDALTATRIINRILSDYDFVGVTDRMDESAVALAMLLGAPLGDVLFLNAKSSGGYDDGVFQNKCNLIQKSFVTDEMKTFFKRDAWQKTISWDEALYVAANAALDLTIRETLGQVAFERNLSIFKKAQLAANQECSKGDAFPCTSDGRVNEKAPCLWSDSGCGYPCLNRIAARFHID